MVINACNPLSHIDEISRLHLPSSQAEGPGSDTLHFHSSPLSLSPPVTSHIIFPKIDSDFGILDKIDFHYVGVGFSYSIMGPFHLDLSNSTEADSNHPETTMISVLMLQQGYFPTDVAPTSSNLVAHHQVPKRHQRLDAHLKWKQYKLPCLDDF